MNTITVINERDAKLIHSYRSANTPRVQDRLKIAGKQYIVVLVIWTVPYGVVGEQLEVIVRPTRTK